MANNILTCTNDPDKWKVALTVCGFNNITISYIRSHGVVTTTDFAGIPYSQMDLFIDNMNKPSLLPVPAQGSTDTHKVESVPGIFRLSQILWTSLAPGSLRGWKQHHEVGQ
jgi:hypothetical protein